MTERKDPILQGYRELVDYIRGLGKAAVAFSGGVDSTFLLKAAVDALGDDALAITIATPVQPQWELDLAGEMAREMGARWQVVRADVLALPAFVENGPQRCYHCKKFLFSKVLELACSQGIEILLDGSNVDDLGDYRPGAQAARELGVRSPLRDLGFDKKRIREASRALGLKTHDLPSFACLASRIPYGTEITEADLRLVEQGEAYLRERAFGRTECATMGIPPASRWNQIEFLIWRPWPGRRTPFSGGWAIDMFVWICMALPPAA